MPMFRDRREAGKRLAKRLPSMEGESPLVIALPRGGVPVAAEIAQRLRAPLDVIVARKIGAPCQPELAIGAVAEGSFGDNTARGEPVTVLNKKIIAELGLSDDRVEQQRATALQELADRATRYRSGHPGLSAAGCTVILVDDGIATGATIEAAVQALRRLSAKRIIIAVPVAPGDTLARLGRLVDEVICLAEPKNFAAIGCFYRDFTQVKDEEVARLLARPRATGSGAQQPEDAGVGN